MTYTLSQGTIGNFETLTVISPRGHSITIIPASGARLNSFVVPAKDGPCDIIDGYEDVSQLEEEYYAKSSLLAPFPNRTAKGRYSFAGEEYQLPINKPDENIAIHGFVSGLPFAVVQQRETESGYEVVLTSAVAPHEGYPFPFTVTVTYVLGQDGLLTVKTMVTNTGETDLPMGLGWHPYFTTGKGVEELSLTLPPVERFVYGERYIPTGELVADDTWLSARQIGDTQLDNGYRFTSDTKKVSIFDALKHLTIEVILNEGYEYLQVFTPPWRTSVAIEPMTCAANALNNKLGLCILSPQAELAAVYSIRAYVL